MTTGIVIDKLNSVMGDLNLRREDIQDLFHVFLNKFEIAGFLLSFQFIYNFLFISCQCDIPEMENTNEILLCFFFRFKHHCKMVGVILKRSKMH